MGIIESYFKPGAKIESTKGVFIVIGYPYTKYIFFKMIDLKDSEGLIKRYRLYKIASKINNGWSLISSTGARVN